MCEKFMKLPVLIVIRVPVDVFTLIPSAIFVDIKAYM